MNLLRRLSLAAALVLALVAPALRAQVPTWAKTNPADITAAGIGVQVRGADYGNGTFVLTAYFGGGNSTATPAAYTSPDGITWTKRTLPTATGTVDIVRFLNGKFYLGVTASNGGSGQILASADGITWTSSGVISSTLNGPNDFAFGNGLYVATVSSSTGTFATQVVTSTDGASWTPRTIAAGISSNHVVFFNGKFYASAYGNPATAGLYSSTDGQSWTKIPGAPANPGLLAASPSALLVTFFSGTTSGQSLSADGATFATASPGISLFSETIRYLNGAFVTSSPPSSTVFDYNQARASFDGRTWATIGSTANVFGASDIAYGGGRYVFVGEFNVFSGTTTVTPGGTSGGGGGTPAPVITTQPTATQSAGIGGSVTFTIVATGTGNTYQWRFNTVAIPGATGASFTLSGLTAANAGSYTVTITNAGGTVTSSASVLAVAATDVAGRLSNISIRASAGTGSQTLIMGVVIGGTGTSGFKPLLIRGSGPALIPFGLTGTLPDPVLTVFNGSNATATNDDWAGTAAVIAQTTAVGAFAFPLGSKDAAISGSLAAGPYSVQLTEKTGASGIALAEIYDGTPSADFTAATPRLINVSARLQVGTGGNILIAGFVVGGGGPRKVLIRAVGPGLAVFGLTGTLADPKLELFSGTAKIDENDNWVAATLADQKSVGAFDLPAGSRDAVLVTTLQPGPYTAQVSGVSNTTGVALVEIYELP